MVESDVPEPLRVEGVLCAHLGVGVGYSVVGQAG